MFFLKLMVFLTRRPRYRPQIVWSKTSLMYNLFRCYELVFGRRAGIKIESTRTPVIVNGQVVKVYCKFYTLESLLVYLESVIREFFKIKWLDVRVTQLGFAIPVNTPQLQIPWISFAIGYTSANNGTSGSNSITYEHVLSGSNPLFAASATNDTAGTGLAATYEGVSASNVGGQVEFIANVRWNSLFILSNPSVGDTVVVSRASTSTIAACSAIYSGCAASQPDAFHTASQASTTSFSDSVTTTVDNCWAIWAVGGGRAGNAGGTGTTKRAEDAGAESTFLDGNAAVTPAGSTTLTVTCSPAATFGGTIASIAPVSAGVVTISSLSLLRTG